MLRCHIEGMVLKLIRNTEYMRTKLFQLCRMEPLSKSRCFVAVCSPWRMLTKAKDMIPQAKLKVGTPHYRTLVPGKLELPKSNHPHDDGCHANMDEL